MLAHVAAIRAISALYVKKRMRWFFLLASVILVLLFALTIYLAQEVSGWWWLLIVPVISFTLIVAILWGLTRALITQLAPPQGPDQREAVAHFVAGLDKALETMQTPQFMIFVYLIRDAFMGNQQGFLQQVFTHSKSLKSEFERLVTLFRPLE